MQVKNECQTMNDIGDVTWPYVHFSDVVAAQPWSRVSIIGNIIDVEHQQKDSRKTGCVLQDFVVMGSLRETRRITCSMLRSTGLDIQRGHAVKVSFANVNCAGQSTPGRISQPGLHASKHKTIVHAVGPEALRNASHVI